VGLTKPMGRARVVRRYLVGRRSRCSNCRRLRQGSLQGTPRTQAQLAFSADDRNWYLVNASPDLRAQIEATPGLLPQEGQRHSPVRPVILTCAELDQVLGLLLLRESQTLQVCATSAVRRILLEDNSIFGMLRASAARRSRSQAAIPFTSADRVWRSRRPAKQYWAFARIERWRQTGLFPRRPAGRGGLAALDGTKRRASIRRHLLDRRRADRGAG
jgi:hypothetical protein